MKTVKTAIVMGLAATALFTATNAMAAITQPTGSAQIKSTQDYPKVCSMILNDGEAGIQTPSGVSAGQAVKQGEIVFQSTFPAQMTFDVEENWTKLETWNNAMPSFWSHSIWPTAGSIDTDYIIIHENGSNTNRGITIAPSADAFAHTYGFYSFAADMYAAGTSEVEVTITASCAEL